VFQGADVLQDFALPVAFLNLQNLVGKLERHLERERGFAVLFQETTVPSLSVHEVHKDTVPVLL